MPPSFFQCTRLVFVALATTAIVHVDANIMVESVDGSFVPLSFVARAAADGGGGIAVKLRNNNDLSYLTTVLMGTPPQQIQMAPSLSQNQISVASPPQGANDISYYNPMISTSYAPGNASANISTIPGGSTTGRFAGEICTLQSATSALSFTYNASVVITDPTVTNDVYPLGARAILGYGVNAPTDSPAGTSLIGSFLPANFTNAICGIELNHIDDPVPDGVLTMGAVDSTVFTGDFTNVMVPSSSLISWSIPFDTLTYLANGLNQSVRGNVASIDIYHSGIQVSNEVAKQIYAVIPGSQAVSPTVWSLPCNSTFPITLTFGGKPFTMYERDTIAKQANGNCTGVITGGADAQGIGKVGAPFLRNVYTQFGAARAANGSIAFSVGFATKKLRQISTPITVTPTSIPNPQTTIRPTLTGTAVGGAPSANTNGALPTRMAAYLFGFLASMPVVLAFFL